jgi:hypothetical protein
MLPRAVLTHLKAGVRAAFGPDPVLTIGCAQSASATLSYQAPLGLAFRRPFAPR